MRQKILKPAPYQFKIFWDDKRYEKQIIELDFKPIIDEYNLSGNYVLLHWQNKPVGLRRFGVYDSLTDQYYGVDADKLIVDAQNPIKAIQINEWKWVNVRPTAVFVIENAVAIYSSEEVLVTNSVSLLEEVQEEKLLED